MNENLSVPEFKNIHERLLFIQQNLKAPKERVNAERPDDVWNWRSAEDILNAVKPILKATGCTVTLSEEPLLVGVSLYQKCTAILTCPGGESISTTTSVREDWSDRIKCATQISGSAVSYARKYALCGLLAIDGGAPAVTTDPDYKSTVPVQAPEPAAPKAPEKPTPEQKPKKPLPKQNSIAWEKGVELAGSGGYTRERLREVLSKKYFFSEKDFDAFAKAAKL